MRIKSFGKIVAFSGYMILLIIPVLIYYKYSDKANQNASSHPDEISTNEDIHHPRSFKTQNRTPPNQTKKIKNTQRTHHSLDAKHKDLITDNLLFTNEINLIDSIEIPVDYDELMDLFLNHVDSATRFASPYYEEICLHLMSKITPWLVNESDWPDATKIDYIQNICETIQRQGRDSDSILNLYIKSLSYAVRDSETFKQYVAEIQVGKNQDWLANLKGTIIGLDINNEYSPEVRIQKISELQLDSTKAYAERAVLRDMPQSSIELGRLFFLSENSTSVVDGILLSHLFPNPDEETINVILGSTNAYHRDMAISSLVTKSYYLNDKLGADFLISKIHDNQIRSEAINNLKAAESRRIQLKNISPIGYPPGIFE